MRSLVVIALIACLASPLAGCDSDDKDEAALDTTPTAKDEPESTSEISALDASDEDAQRNPVMYGPHADIVAVVMQTEPWLTVIGSDTPAVAVYADGTVVYLAKLPDEDTWTYLETKLNEVELQDLKKKLGPTEAFMALESFIDLMPDGTDMPRTKIYLSDGTHTKAVSVRAYASTARRAEIQQQWPDATWPEHEQLGEFDRVYDVLTGLESADAHEWQPPYVELYVYGSWSLDEWRERLRSHEGFGSAEPYFDPPHWPQNWPTFNDPLTWDWGDSSYSLYLRGSALRNIERFFQTEGKHGIALINDRVYCASYRYAFPGEGTYRDAFDEAEKDDNPGRLGL